MDAYNKKQINITNLTSNDEVVFYRTLDSCSSIKMIHVNGARLFVIDLYTARAVFTSKTYSSLTNEKKHIGGCHHQ